MAPDFLAHPTFGLAQLTPAQRRTLIGHVLHGDLVAIHVTTARPRGAFDNPSLQRIRDDRDAVSIVTLPAMPAIEGRVA